jgi:hypothetical protein
MSLSKSENYQDDEKPGVARDRKLRKRRQPRGRRLVRRKKPQIEAQTAQEARLGSAKQKIAKHVDLFPEVTSAEGRSQVEKYLGWVADSLSHHELTLNVGDIEYKTAVASVKAGGQKRQKTRTSVRATHLPTLISVKNEETRSLDQNKRAAYDNLRLRLTDHLSLWQTLSQNLPQQYSASEIKQHGVDLLKELS